METVFNYATDFFKNMTNLFLVMVSFGVMAEIVFGGGVFGISVIANVWMLLAALARTAL
jgi:hypothetical protein